LETSDHIAVLSCQISWSDVGSWYSLMQLADKDINGNNFIGNITAKNVSNSYLRSDSHKIVAIGLDDFLVVASKEATLIAPLKDSQAIKQIYQEISLYNKEITEKSLYKKSPWGEQEKLGEGDNFLVKHIKIKIGESISLQQHQHRAEHWIVIAGTALVECGGKQKTVQANQSVFIPMQEKHRLTNIGDCELQIIEVQTGQILSEDDIIRFEDIYGRI